MPTDSTPHRGRGYGHRGRRGSDRRGPDRRSQTPSQPQPSSRGADHVDVEQIMRDIRARISQQHGIDLTEQQVQELAARRLESILDVRTVNPALVQQIRESASSGRVVSVPSQAEAPPYQFEESTLYDSSRALLRTIRRLLNPVLKLFFNPNPLIQALNTQARLNVDAAKREAERDQRQAEWNALHYEILQRVVTENARVSLEVESLGLRVESLAAKVDFNERRVRGVEGAMHVPDARTERTERPERAERPERSERSERSERPERTERPERPPAPQVARVQEERPAPPQVSTGGAPVGGGQEPATGEAPRRRRRRRRGRRGPGQGEANLPPGAASAGDASQGLDADGGEGADGDDQDDTLDVVTTEGEAIVVQSAGPIAPAPTDVAAEVSPFAPETREPVATEPPAAIEQPPVFEPSPHGETHPAVETKPAANAAWAEPAAAPLDVPPPDADPGEPAPAFPPPVPEPDRDDR